MIEIISGLVDDEDVVTVGQIGLKDQAKVTVINASENVNLAERSDNSDEETGDASTD